MFVHAGAFCMPCVCPAWSVWALSSLSSYQVAPKRGSEPGSNCIARRGEQVWEAHERARQAGLVPYARIEVAANNPLLEPLRAGPLLDTQHELMRR